MTKKPYDPYKEATPEREQKLPMTTKKETVKDILTLPCLAIESRGISKESAKHFGIRTSVDEQGNHEAHYFPYFIKGELTGYKKRDLTLPKKAKYHFTSIGLTGPECDLFGSDCGNKTGGKKVWVCEGEYDAAIVWQVLKSRYPKKNPTVLSIATGTASAVQNIGNKNNQRYLKKFQEVILAFDGDKASPEERSKGIKKGKDAIDEVYGLMPDILVVNIPDDQDPCEIFNEFSEEEFYWLFMKPTPYTPEGFVKFEDIRSKALEMPKLGRKWPWEGLTRKTLGRREGEGIYIGAGVKIGKCFGRGTKIRMYDNTLKAVQLIQTGDLVMGWDSTPRKVLETHSGVDKLYKVCQDQGIDYTVNSQHTLCLRNVGNRSEVVNISVEDFISEHGLDNFNSNLRGFYVLEDKPFSVKKNYRTTLIKLQELSEGDYYGFEIEGDHKFLLQDNTVVHNSTFADKLIEHITNKETDEEGKPLKASVFKFEEQPEETLKKAAGKFYKKDFTNPERVIFIDEEGKEVDVWGNPVIHRELFFTQDELEEAIDSVGDSLILYNNYGRCHWDQLKGAIRHAVLVEGSKDIFIDPIGKLVTGLSPSDANTELSRFAEEIAKMAQDLGFTYYCFCHLKSPLQGKPHEFGGKIYSSQFTGSREMMRTCYYTMGLEGNKDDTLSQKERNTRWIVILDDRKYGRVGRVALFYDQETGDFVEPPDGFLEDDDCQTLREWYAKYPDGSVDKQQPTF